MNLTKISQKMISESLLSIEKILQNEKERLIIKSNDLKSCFGAINLLQRAYLNKNFKSRYENR